MNEYHILSLSGGKDSTALAFYIKDNMPEVHEQIEYVFCDTEVELPENYEYLDKIEIFLDKPITRLKPYKSFDHLYAMYKFIPSRMHRWCTVELKTKTFRKYIYDRFIEGDKGNVNMYIGIRADEAHRATDDKGDGNYIKAHFPFVENGLNEREVHEILEKNGIGLPEYYKWSKRSGCYFCFFQSKMSWINLYEHHPDLFQKAMDYEFEYNSNGKTGYTRWNAEMPLKEMILPENIKKIKDDFEKLQKRNSSKKIKANTFFDTTNDDENTCLFCHI